MIVLDLFNQPKRYDRIIQYKSNFDVDGKVPQARSIGGRGNGREREGGGLAAASDFFSETFFLIYIYQIELQWGF